MPTVSVELDPEQIKEAAAPFVKAMNEAQALGFTIHEVIAASLYISGSAIKQIGGGLLVDAPLREALPPLVLGYDESVFDPSKLRK